MVEIWKSHNELTDYEFSNLGKMRILGSYIKSCKTGQDGYVRFTVKGKRYSMHRVIAELFCKGKTEEKNIVDHINGLRDDNRAENLRWVTISENNSNRRFDGVYKIEQTKIDFVSSDYWMNRYLKQYKDYNTLFNDYMELQKLYIETINKSFLR